MSHDRVVDEHAPVTVLAPENPRAAAPQSDLGAATGRAGCRSAGSTSRGRWDPAYQPILETHDPGEAPLEGGLLVATVGKGTYVYTGLSFFRQLPAGVPGAFRLFANLLALGQPLPR